MGKRIELTGQVFGRLTVIEFSCVKNGNSYWLCRCDCGNEKIISANNLKNGHTQSCGCLHREVICKFQDLVGQSFGRLEVINYSYRDKYGALYWLCHCECGEEKIINGANLKNGHTQSCGCFKREQIHNSNFRDLTGIRFGKLIVTKFSHMNKKAYWLCKCDCGKEKVISGNSLKSGYTQSCGCLIDEKLSGKNHWNWKGGITTQQYPSEWTDELRESIRNRDRRKCQFQDCEYNDTKEDRKLSVHHIDSNKQNCEQYNLISLCNSHHQIIEHNNPETWIDYFYQITGDYK